MEDVNDERVAAFNGPGVDQAAALASGAVQYETIMGPAAYGVSLTEVEMILVEQDIDLQRNNDQLKAIRRGEWTEERLSSWCAEKESHLERAYAESALRATPDEPRIRALLLHCLEEHYGTLEGCVVNPDRAVEALRNIEAELGRVRDLL